MQVVLGIVLALLAVAAALTAVAALVAAGSVWGAVLAVSNYAEAVIRNVGFETAASIPANAEPAVKSYFFGKGYRDLKATIKDSWNRNSVSSTEIWGKGAAADNQLFAFLFYGAAVAVMVYGTIFFLTLSLLHVVALGICYLAIGSLFLSVYGAERAYLLIKGFLTVCPSCHVRASLPVYLCDGCNRAEHRHLLPSSYGTFHHRCRCGQKLPSTFFLNRGRLVSKCPQCNYFLSRTHSESVKTIVPVIGGPSVGKTAYMIWLVQKLCDRAAAGGQTIGFLDDGEKSRYETSLEALRRGRMPAKTVATTPTAFNLISDEATKNPHTVYLYDPAGEAFGGEAELSPNRFLEYCSGILFLIDPFSIPAVQEAYGIDSGRPGSFAPSSQRPDDLLDRLLFMLEKNFGHHPAESIRIPIAVVLTKVDAFDLERLLGHAGLPAGLSDGALDAACSERIQAQLKKWDMTPLVENIESRFRDYRFFSFSAVGFERSPSLAFSPQRVERPYYWLLSRREANGRLWS